MSGLLGTRQDDIAAVGIDETIFASETRLASWCERIGAAGLRGTASPAHERLISWVEEELQAVPGMVVRTDEYSILGWAPSPSGDLASAGVLRVADDRIEIAGAVPYSRPGSSSGELVHLERAQDIGPACAGKIVLRDFPDLSMPYDQLLRPALHVSPDMESLRHQAWDRPGFADTILHNDLLAAGQAGAAGVIFAFDLPREQVSGYFEPHKGTHYRVPAAFVGVRERDRLLAMTGATAHLAVSADVGPARTRNVFGTLPGRSKERIVLVTHTDGNTWVQDNGIAALLALARYFAERPLERTLEFSFTSAHLHISREGALRYAKRLDAEYDEGTVAFAFPIEHLGARELVPVLAPDGMPGRELAFTGHAEPVLWAAGPSEPIRAAVSKAVAHRRLERVIMTPGLGTPVPGRVPAMLSFGGLGTYFNQQLIPTTSILSAPWSLWAPHFGSSAVDIALLRRQSLACGDVVAALDKVPRTELSGDYLADRSARAAGAPIGVDMEPPEVA
ncbi:hypothetical protein [Streptomyces fractus]|uniref:hypothetical protein n=1 Tax=Streptomyces fractus TaxID=641806 RepID=UPI003CEF673F